MSIKEQIEQDIKLAMLSGDKTLVTTLRGLKSAILNAEVAKGARASGLPDTEIIDILAKEAKKRQESADMYNQGGRPESADAEMTEKQVIEKYLPAQLAESDISQLVSDVIAEQGASGMQAMGQVIGVVKQRTAGSADGAVIARIVKEKLTNE
jgi:hypothetical protein